MKIVSVNFSVNNLPDSIQSWKEKLFQNIREFINNGAEVIVYPELFLMSISQYFHWENDSQELAAISSFVSNELLPDISKSLPIQNILLILGSFPRMENNKFFNSSPIFHDGKVFFKTR